MGLALLIAFSDGNLKQSVSQYQWNKWKEGAMKGGRMKGEVLLHSLIGHISSANER